MAQHNELGKVGEQLAKDHLISKGYEILQQNFRYQHAEIDLIAQKKKEIVFVEVKARTGSFFGNPEDFVTYQKEKLFELAANEFIERSGHEGECRFDIISIIFSKTDETHQLHHIEDAFFPR